MRLDWKWSENRVREVFRDLEKEKEGQEGKTAKEMKIHDLLTVRFVGGSKGDKDGLVHR